MPPLSQLVRWGCAGGLAGAAVTLIALRALPSQVVSPWWILAFPVLYWIALAVHELGHVAAGLAAGARLYGLSAGPLCIRRTYAGLRFARPENWFEGVASVRPLQLSGARRRMLSMVAGGPAASLGLAALCLAPGAELIRSGAALAGFWLLALGLFSVLVACHSLVPAVRHGVRSDGSLLKLLWSDGPESRRWCAILVLMAEEFDRRPSTWSGDAVAAAAALDDATLDDAQGCAFAYYFKMDCGCPEEAGPCIDRAASLQRDHPSYGWPNLLAELAWYEGAVRHRLAHGRTASLQAIDQGADLPFLLRAEAALLRLAGDIERSRATAVTGLAAQRSFVPGIDRWSREQIMALALARPAEEE
ncbi:MAG TPA: hypothetical protein DEH78_03825 [Solibacterales bacterium]|nr:hypothetical protein [Bryobacterales bacterium]